MIMYHLDPLVIISRKRNTNIYKILCLHLHLRKLLGPFTTRACARAGLDLEELLPNQMPFLGQGSILGQLKPPFFGGMIRYDSMEKYGKIPVGNHHWDHILRCTQSEYGFEGMNGWMDCLLLTLIGDHTGWSLWTWYHCCSRYTRYALWYHETIGGCELLNADLKISAPTGDPHQRQYVFICKSVAIWLLQLDTICTSPRNVLDQAFTFTIFHQRWSSQSLAVPCSPPRSAAPVAPVAPFAPGVSSTEPQRWVLWMSIPHSFRCRQRCQQWRPGTFRCRVRVAVRVDVNGLAANAFPGHFKGICTAHLTEENISSQNTRTFLYDSTISINLL